MNNKVAIYCRLSEEDRNKKNKNDDSGSIANQKLMLSEYAHSQGWDIYEIYSDDDYAGSDRNRPAFNRMISDARSKKFDIILCKTQSRFTRELEIVEKYIHFLFPQLGIRFVSIVDNVDTSVAGNKKARQINGLINEWYLEDMSDSIKAALKTRMKAGYFIGSFAPYGYKKDPNEKGRLIIDEEAAEIVREIFDLYNQGIGRTSIAKILNERGVPSPEEYYKIKGIKRNTIGKKNARFWKYYTISHILENEVYIGNLIQGKAYNPTYKSKHSIPSSPDNWIRVNNTHDPIIGRDVWDKTRRLWNQRTKPCYNGESNKYSGMLVCSKCGYRMGVAYNKHKRYYRCNSAKYGKICCEGTSIFESTLDTYILKEVQALKKEYLQIDNVEKSVDFKTGYDRTIERCKKQISVFNTKIEELDIALRNLYIDKLKNVVSELQFVDLSKSFETEKESYISKISELNLIMDTESKNNINIVHKRELIEEMLSFKAVTRQFVDSYIKRIEIDGTKNNRRIDIYWKF